VAHGTHLQWKSWYGIFLSLHKQQCHHINAQLRSGQPRNDLERDDPERSDQDLKNGLANAEALMQLKRE
jgi:hypothetical protein